MKMVFLRSYTIGWFVSIEYTILSFITSIGYSLIGFRRKEREKQTFAVAKKVLDVTLQCMALQLILKYGHLGRGTT
jgi:hypothetical protein